MHSRLAALTIVTALVAATAAVSIPASAVGTFTDDDGNVHEAAIERIAALGITRGCNPPDNTRFCPDDNVTRGQMAAFLVRTFDLTTTGSSFTDTSSSVFAQDIDRLATAGITRGCNPPDNTRFCPGDLVTRGQMAAFLVRALGLTDLSTSAFTDTIGHVFEQDISRLAAAGITRGCNPPVNDRFCPDQPVRRDEMATFLNRTYDIHVTGTTTTSTTSTTATSSTLTTSTSPTTSPTTTIPKPPSGWAAMEPLDAGLTDAAGAHLDGMLYLAGGKRSATNRVDDFLRYDPATDGWTTLADIPGPGREDVSLVAADGSLYVFGGASQNAFEGNIQTAARFTPGSGWSDPAVADLPSGRSGAAAVLYGGDIWLIGGFGPAGVSLSSVLIYDLATNSYSSGPALPSPRDHAGAAVVGGALYVLGGRDLNGTATEPSRVIRLDSPSDTSWQEVGQPMPNPRRSFVVGVTDGRIQLFGGESGQGASHETIDNVDEFDPNSGAWTQLSSTGFTPRHGPAGATIGPSTYVVGGSLGSGSANLTDVNERFTR